MTTTPDPLMQAVDAIAETARQLGVESAMAVADRLAARPALLPRSTWEAANMAAFMVKCNKWGCGADVNEPCNYAQGKFKGQVRRATHGRRRDKGRLAYESWARHIQQWV